TVQMNGFKEKEIGEIPVGWEVVTIEDLVKTKALSLQNGFACGNHNEDGRGIPHIRPFNLDEDNAVTFGAIKYIETDRSLDKYLIRAGDVLFNNTNSEELVGKTALWQRSGIYVPPNHMTIMRVEKPGAVEAYYLAALFHFKWLNR